MTGLHTRSRAVRTLISLVMIAASLAVFAPASSAGPSNPAQANPNCGKEGHPPCPADQPLLSIKLSIDAGPVRIRVGVDACGYAPGTKGVLVFTQQINDRGTTVLDPASAGTDGCMVGEGPTQVAVGGLQLISAVQSTDGYAAHITVPGSAMVGPKFVCSYGVGYDLKCASFDVTAAKASGGGGGGSRDSLALTGVAIGILLAVALALVVVGRAMLSASRAHRRSRIVTEVALRERTSTSV